MKQIKTDQLLIMLSNATVTYYECSGHHKANMNELRCNDYKKQLQKRKVNIPTDTELLSTGIFNGEGAY